MRDDNVLADETDADRSGAVYVVSVSGPKLYDIAVQRWMVSNAEKKQFYQLIRIDGDKLQFEARTADGELYDQFEIRKRANGGNQLVERGQSPDGDSGDARRTIVYALGTMVVLVAGFALFRAVRRKPAASPI